MIHPRQWFGLVGALLACLLPAAASPQEPAPGKAAGLAEALKKVALYEFGDSRRPLTVVAGHVQKALTDPAERRAVAKKLGATLESVETSAAGKRFLCRQLGLAGDAEVVPVLADLLSDKDLSHMARFALQRIPGPEADQALRRALFPLEGALRIGVIASIGQRGDAGAVAALANCLAGADHDTAAAAAAALGKIGGKEAAAALGKALDGGNARLFAAVAEARLRCADGFLAGGEVGRGLEIYRGLYAPGMPPEICRAALAVLADREENGFNRILEALRHGHPALAGVAVDRVRRGFPGPAVTRKLVEEIPGLTLHRRSLLVKALGERGDPIARPAALAAAGSPDAELSIAGLEALGSLGNDEDVNVLLAAAVKKSDAGKAARLSLRKMRSPAVDPALLRALAGAEAGGKVVLIETLQARQSPGAVPVLLTAARDKDRKVRRAAFAALNRLARGKDVSDLITLVLETRPKEQKSARRALASACKLLEDKAARLHLVLEAMKDAEAPLRCALLPVLSLLGGARAREAVRSAREDSDAEVQDAAVRALCNWIDADPAAEVLDIAGKSENKTHRVLALRGYARMVGLKGRKNAEKCVKMYQDGLAAAREVREKKLMISGLGKLKRVSAMKAVQPHLDDEDLRDEAEAAIVRLAGSHQGSGNARALARAGRILKIVIDGTRDEKRKIKALKAARRLKARRRAIRMGQDDE